MRHVFAGIRVSDLAGAADWFARLLGREASFVPNDTELVWDHCDGVRRATFHDPDGNAISVADMPASPG